MVMTDDPTALPTWVLTAVDDIIDDLTSRRGLRQEFDNIDLEIQDEIRMKWASIISNAAGSMNHEA